MSSYQYRKSHCGDKTVVRSSYLLNVIPPTGKMTSLYWISPLSSWWALRTRRVLIFVQSVLRVVNKIQNLLELLWNQECSVTDISRNRTKKIWIFDNGINHLCTRFEIYMQSRESVAKRNSFQKNTERSLRKIPYVGHVEIAIKIIRHMRSSKIVICSVMSNSNNLVKWNAFEFSGQKPSYV